GRCGNFIIPPGPIAQVQQETTFNIGDRYLEECPRGRRGSIARQVSQTREAGVRNPSTLSPRAASASIRMLLHQHQEATPAAFARGDRKPLGSPLLSRRLLRPCTRS